MFEWPLGPGRPPATRICTTDIQFGFIDAPAVVELIATELLQYRRRRRRRRPWQYRDGQRADACVIGDLENSNCSGAENRE